ncbi:SIR2 family protein [Roseibium porphyridii]|uniref:SIR2 family protein n=1 Tax=Roseibium porphyridii TaxID=2866279 RepID=A0ABY8EY40_9HYPH|nr:SIR2 family protein [Roseibium sp. KMA01]WFE88001.1 SIR2 family protein [Roseibium sp. KMA01]
MPFLEDLLPTDLKPALLIGNGINRYGGSQNASWEGLLKKLSNQQGLSLTDDEMKEMSNTEFFDILDLGRPLEEKVSLQKAFCDLMTDWRHSSHHSKIVTWAKSKRTPIITVNFDENLSRSIDAKFIRSKEGFTDYYPWSSYFSDQAIDTPRNSFAIWHAHGMMRYRRSIRLGLTHYMGAVQRARHWVYAGNGLRRSAKDHTSTWRGSDTWLDILFHSPLLIFGFGFGKDENFFRWLFLERARLQRLDESFRQPAWFIDVENASSKHRRPFFERLGMQFVTVPSYSDIYEASFWSTPTP